MILQKGCWSLPPPLFTRCDPSSPIHRDHLDLPWVSPEDRETVSPAMAARDFIAGMTDRYFNRAVNACRDAAGFPPGTV